MQAEDPTTAGTDPPSPAHPPLLAAIDRIARIAILLAVMVLLMLGAYRLVPAVLDQDSVPPADVDEGDLRYVFPEAESFSARSREGGIEFYPALKRVAGGGAEGSSRVGVCFLTTGIEGGATGYAGPIQVLVGISNDGRIQGIKVMPGRNRESAGFVDRLYEQEFDARYRGKDCRDPFNSGVDVDAVSGATVSVDAVNASVRNSARLVAQSILGLDPGGRDPCILPGLSSIAGPGAALLLLLSGATSSLIRAGRAWRLMLLAAAVVAALALSGTYVSTADAARALSWNPVPGRSFYPWAALLASALVATVLAGKAWCAWACPFGAAQELLFSAVPWRLPVSERADRRLRRVRWFVLAASFLLAAVAADPGILRFEPLASSFRFRALTLGSGALLALVLAASIFVERFHCKYLCPVGALIGLIAANRLFWRKRGAACGGCLRCESGCRYVRENGPEYARRGPRMHGDCIC